jgi:hypothetical protein
MDRTDLKRLMGYSLALVVLVLVVLVPQLIFAAETTGQRFAECPEGGTPLTHFACFR